MRILITGANAPGSSGTAWSLLDTGLFSRIPELFGSDISPGSPTTYLNKVHQLPHGSDADYLERLVALCSKERFDLVVPQTTAETIQLAANLKSVSDHVMVAILRPESIIKTLVSKISTYEVIRNLDICTQDFHICRDKSELLEYIFENKGKQIFIKANSLSGGRGIVSMVSHLSNLLLTKPNSYHTITLDQAAQAFDALNDGSGVLVQLAVSGTEYSIDCYRDETVSIAVPRSRDKIRSGVSHETTVVFHKDLIEFATVFGNRFDLQGTFGLQCIVTPTGEISFLECNPRIQGTMVASTMAGENLIGRGARLALGLESQKIKNVNWGTKFSRSSGGIGIFNGAVTEI